MIELIGRGAHKQVGTESGPGSPRGQPAWGGGCDRVMKEHAPGAPVQRFEFGAWARMLRVSGEPFPQRTLNAILHSLRAL